MCVEGFVSSSVELSNLSNAFAKVVYFLLVYANLLLWFDRFDKCSQCIMHQNVMSVFDDSTDVRQMFDSSTDRVWFFMLACMAAPLF